MESTAALANHYAECPHIVTHAWLAEQRLYLARHEAAERALRDHTWAPAVKILGLLWAGEWVCTKCGDGAVLRIADQAACGCGTPHTRCTSLAEADALMAAATAAQRAHVALLEALLA